MMAFGSVDAGVVLIAATSLLWPAACWLYVAVPQQVGLPAWKVFARGAVAAMAVAALFVATAGWLLATNGTSRSMVSIAPQVAALTCLGGAVLCGATAFVLHQRWRHRSGDRRDGQSPGG